MADLTVRLFGLSFPHPVVPGAGPLGDSKEAIAKTLAGGAAAAVTRTLTLAPVADPPGWVTYAGGGLFNRQQGSSVPFARWDAEHLPEAIAAARQAEVPFIASIGYQAEDLVAMGTRLQVLGVDALEVSTHYLERDRILPAVRRLREAVRLPLLVKLSPHHGEDLADLAAELEAYVDGFTVINSFGPTLLLDAETARPAIAAPAGIGYLSGGPIRPIAQRFVFEVARRVRKPVVACGGVERGEDVIEFLMLGASLVQVCTRAIVRGPQVYREIAQQVGAWLDRHGYSSVAEVQGLYLRKYGHGQYVITEKQEAPQLNEAACIKCSQCETVCFYDAIKAPPKVLPTISHEPCFQCGLCVSVCPTDALFFRPRDQVTRVPAAV